MQPQLIIFEGPDACGKTTAAINLAKSLNATYWHLTCTSLLAPAMLDYQKNAIENIQENLEMGRSVVMDRAWPSELCYGSHFRGVTKASILEIVEGFASFNPTFVFCMDLQGSKNAAARHRENLDPAHPYSDRDFTIVYNTYERLIENWDYKDGEKLVKYFNDSEDWKTDMAAWLGFTKQHLAAKL